MHIVGKYEGSQSGSNLDQSNETLLTTAAVRSLFTAFDLLSVVFVKNADEESIKHTRNELLEYVIGSIADLSGTDPNELYQKIMDNIKR